MMIDKFGRNIAHTEVGGRHEYLIAGKATIILDSETGALARIEKILPDVSDYSSAVCDFSKYPFIFEPDFEGSTYGGQLKAKLFGSISSARDGMTKLIFNKYNERMEEVFDFYPKHEPSTWPLQKTQALSWFNLNNAEKDSVILSYGDPMNQFTLLLSVANKLSGNLTRASVDDLVGKISQNGFVFEIHCGELTGYVSRLRVILAQALTVEDFLSIDFEFLQIPHLLERF